MWRIGMAVAVLVLATGCGSDRSAAPAAVDATPTTTPTTTPTDDPAPPLPAVPADLERVARYFLAFARGESDYPPADTPVELSLGAHVWKTLSSGQLGDRRVWRVCPDGGSYAGRVCPFSAVDVIREYDGPVTITDHPLRHPCVPASAMTAANVTITPDAATSCLDYWAVQLDVNDVGQVTGVNLVQAEP
jgi:hypothetical protein